MNVKWSLTFYGSLGRITTLIGLFDELTLLVPSKIWIVPIYF